MSDVKVNIHGRVYDIACDDGQESRVIEVGQYVDARARDIAAAGAASSETNLLVLTAIVLADEIKELREALVTSGSNAAGNNVGSVNVSVLNEEEERQIVGAITHLCKRIEGIAEKIQKVA